MLCFQKQNTVSFRFSAPDLGFSFLHGTSYKKFASLSSLTSWKISSIPGGDAMQQTRSFREGGWPFAHGAARTCTQTEERACLPEGEKAMQKVACFKLCSMDSLILSFAQARSLSQCLWASVRPCSFLLVVTLNERRCAFRARCLVIWGCLISASLRSNWPRGKMAKRVNTQHIGWSGCNVLEQ